MGVQLFVKIF